MLRKLCTLSGLAGLAFFLIASGHPSYALPRPDVIRITDRTVRVTTVDNGRRGLSPGDVEITRLSLFNERITSKPIGHAELVCTYTGDSKNCTGTFVLPRGKIVVGGTIRFKQLYQLAVLGGTNLYNNVRGTVTVTSLGGKPARHVLFFRLVV